MVRAVLVGARKILLTQFSNFHFSKFLARIRERFAFALGRAFNTKVTFYDSTHGSSRATLALLPRAETVEPLRPSGGRAGAIPTADPPR